jgi:hypothetical protein
MNSSPACIMPPHFEGASLVIEKCQSLLPANGASMFVGQSQQMRKCDFGHHSVYILICAS